MLRDYASFRAQFLVNAHVTSPTLIRWDWFEEMLEKITMETPYVETEDLLGSEGDISMASLSCVSLLNQRDAMIESRDLGPLRFPRDNCRRGSCPPSVSILDGRKYLVDIFPHHDPWRSRLDCGGHQPHALARMFIPAVEVRNGHVLRFRTV